MSAILAAILLAAAPAVPAVPAPGSPEAAVAAIYAPYSGPADATPSWERPVYSRQITGLIARWRTVTPQDEPDALSDGDWLCLCQDFDNQAFKAAVVSKRQLRGGTMQVAVRLDLGDDARRDVRLLLKREGGAWKIDDLYASPDFPNGLRQKLQETILEDSIQ
ncbi:MAG: DUF3828 domain-containing protein [Novosphingobium sp.]